MRHRLEDLGRLSVMLSNLLDHELFERRFRPHRPKDYDEWFKSQTEDQKDEILRSWVYGIENFSEKIYEMLSIAEGTDLLNEQNNDERK